MVRAPALAGIDQQAWRFLRRKRGVADQVTVPYRAKHDRYGPAIVGSVLSADAVRSTLRLAPR